MKSLLQNHGHWATAFIPGCGWTATIAAKARPCGHESAQQKRVGENSEMSSRHKQFRKRLAIVEKSLSQRSQRTEAPLCVQVQLEAQQELSPEDLQLLNSGNTASLDFHARKLDNVPLNDVTGKQVRNTRPAKRLARLGFMGTGHTWVASLPDDSRDPPITSFRVQKAFP